MFWPQQGDLFNQNKDVVTITEEQEEEQSKFNNGGEPQILELTSELGLNANGEDLGPVPLQNDGMLDTTYEGIGTLEMVILHVDLLWIWQ